MLAAARLTAALDAEMNLTEKFHAHTQNLEEKLAQDEWFFTKFRAGIVSPLSPDEAFDLIPQAVELVLRQDDLRGECFQLLLDLVRQADTTEMPHELAQAWTDLLFHIGADGHCGKRQAQELCRWYRREHPNHTLQQT